MPGDKKTFSDEIAEKVIEVVSTSTMGDSDSQKSGLVIGEDHTNNEFHQLLVSHILPQSSEIAADQEKKLFLEWDRTPENLSLIQQFNETGDSNVRDNLVKGNINFQNDNAERLVEQDFVRVLDSARENGFQIALFDEEGVSVDTYYQKAAEKSGKPVFELTREEIDQAQAQRVEDSNPVMAKNIQSQLPDNSFSIVLVGDAHAAEANDLPEILGFEYVRFTRIEPESPSVEENVDGARYDIGLVNYDMSRDFIAVEVERLGIDVLPVFLGGDGKEPWGGEENKAFMTGIDEKLQRAANLVAAEKYEDAQKSLGEAKEAIEDRWEPEQIADDPYIKSVVSLIDSADSVIEEQAPEIQSPVEVPVIKQELGDVPIPIKPN